MWLIFLLLWLTTMGVFVFRKSAVIFSPVFWLGSAWLFTLGLYYTCGYEYSYPLKITGLLYFAGLFVCFTVGYILAVRLGGISKKKTSLGTTMETNFALMEQDGKEMVKNIYFLIVIIGFIVFFVDFILQNTGSSGDLHTQVRSSSIGTIGKIMLLNGLIIWLYGCVYAIKNNERIHITACIAAVLYLMPAVLTSGRQSILVIGIATVAAIFIALRENRKYKYLKEFYVILSLVAVLLIVYCVYVAIFRTEIADKLPLFEYMFNCKISDSTKNLLEKTGPLKMFFLEIVSYYSHELPMFQVLLDNWDGELFLGSSQFQLISRNLPADSFYYFENIWAKIEEISSSAGLYSHVWRTMAGDCLVDYGIVGGLGFMGILGFISGKVYKKTKSRNSVFDVVLLSMVNAACFFSVQFSPFVEDFWYFPLFWLLIGLPFVWFFLKKFAPVADAFLEKKCPAFNAVLKKIIRFFINVWEKMAWFFTTILEKMASFFKMLGGKIAKLFKVILEKIAVFSDKCLSSKKEPQEQTTKKKRKKHKKKKSKIRKNKYNRKK